MKIRDRLWAFGWFCYVVGTVVATKGFEPRLQYEVLKWWGKLLIIFMIAFTMLLGYFAGKEREEYGEN